MQDFLNPSDSPSWGGDTGLLGPPGTHSQPPPRGGTYFPAPVCSELMSGPTLQALSQVGGKREQMGV